MKTLNTQLPGIRYQRSTPPLFMLINLENKKCWCGKPKELFEPHQQKYCCTKHADAYHYTFYNWWNSFRYEIIRRDNFTCQECGISKDKLWGTNDFRSFEGFEVDHILAIVNGGMCFDRENVRTLCVPCHHKKTSQDMKIVKRIRRKLKSLDIFT